MMGRREDGQGQFFYLFNLDKVVSANHLAGQSDGFARSRLSGSATSALRLFCWSGLCAPRYAEVIMLCCAERRASRATNGGPND
jgi:hypothetical protein